MYLPGKPLFGASCIRHWFQSMGMLGCRLHLSPSCRHGSCQQRGSLIDVSLGSGKHRNCNFELTITMPSNIVTRSDCRNMYHCVPQSEMRVQSITQLLTVCGHCPLEYRTSLIFQLPIVCVEKGCSSIGGVPLWLKERPE